MKKSSYATCWGLLTLILLLTSQDTLAVKNDSGYFLGMRQKGQLIAYGKVEDSKGQWYDIWICPGYVWPTKIARKGFCEAGKDYKRYFKASKYKRLARQSGNSYEFAFEDCLWDFTVKGVPKAWGKHFEKASKRTEKRVFGWWISYPWAFLTSTIETAFRIPVGLAGCAVGTAWGTAVVPAYHIAEPAIDGTLTLGFQGLVFPISGYAWNTVVSPPLAMLGQQPSPERVDGFWVVRLSEEQNLRQSALIDPLTDEEVEHICNLILHAKKKITSVEEKMACLNKQTNDKIKALREETRKSTKSLNERKKNILKNIRNDKELMTPLIKVSQQRINITRDGRRRIQQHLNKLTNTNNSWKTMYLINDIIPYKTEDHEILRKKTDPVRYTVDKLKDPDKYE